MTRQEKRSIKRTAYLIAKQAIRPHLGEHERLIQTERNIKRTTMHVEYHKGKTDHVYMGLHTATVTYKIIPAPGRRTPLPKPQ